MHAIWWSSYEYPPFLLVLTCQVLTCIYLYFYLEVDSVSLGSQERFPPPHLCCIRWTGGRTQNVIQQGWPASDPATYPLWFTPDIHQKKNTRLKTSYLFKDPVTKDKTKAISIFRVQISWRTRFTSKYVCFPSHRESLVVTRGVRQGPCPLNLQKRKICWRPFETT